MATFLPYASCYGNKLAWQAMGKNRRSWLSLLGAPPCLRHSHRRRARSPAPELTVKQLTRLIRSLREIRCNGELQPTEGASSLAVSRESPSCRPQRGGHRISCLRCWMTQGNVMVT